jgi:hypothetical protein
MCLVIVLKEIDNYYILVKSERRVKIAANNAQSLEYGFVNM